MPGPFRSGHFLVVPPAGAEAERKRRNFNGFQLRDINDPIFHPTSLFNHWQFSGLLNNVHTAKDGDFSQAETITHTGALLVGTYDSFTDGDPSEFLRNLNDHMPAAKENKLIFIEKTGHTYQMKNQEVAEEILRQLQECREE